MVEVVIYLHDRNHHCHIFIACAWKLRMNLWFKSSISEILVLVFKVQFLDKVKGRNDNFHASCSTRTLHMYICMPRDNQETQTCTCMEHLYQLLPCLYEHSGKILDSLHNLITTQCKNTSPTDILVGVRSSASQAILRRRDFDPIQKHKFAFTIFTSTR